MAPDTIHLRTVVNEDGAAILDTKHGSLSTLNNTGSYVWQALERGQSEETIVANLANETGTSIEVITHDVRKFVASLQEHRLLLR